MPPFERVLTLTRRAEVVDGHGFRGARPDLYRSVIAQVVPTLSSRQVRDAGPVSGGGGITPLSKFAQLRNLPV